MVAEEKEEEVEEDVVVVVVEVLWMVLLRLWDVLYTFTDEKEQVTDRLTDGRTLPFMEMRGRI